MKKVIAVLVSGMALAFAAQAEVKIGGNNDQKVTVKNGAVANMAIGPAAQAKQNLASNKGNVNIGALTQDVTVAAKEVVNIKAENNSVMVGAGQHIQLKAAESITFLVGDNDAYIKLIKGGKVEIFGKDTGVIDLVGLLDIFGKKINLNCSDE